MRVARTEKLLIWSEIDQLGPIKYSFERYLRHKRKAKKRKSQFLNNIV